MCRRLDPSLVPSLILKTNREHSMADEITTEIDELQYMSTNELAEMYHDLHGQPVRTRHRQYLIRKLAWRIQANAMGDLSDRARKRARELANDSDIRVMAPKSMICPPQAGLSRTTTKRYTKRDPRIPDRRFSDRASVQGQDRSSHRT